jgi:hypothetical protein
VTILHGSAAVCSAFDLLNKSLQAGRSKQNRIFSGYFIALGLKYAK